MSTSSSAPLVGASFVISAERRGAAGEERRAELPARCDYRRGAAELPARSRKRDGPSGAAGLPARRG